MDGLRDEVGTQGVHLDDGRHLARVAEVVGVHPTSQAGRRFRLDGDDPMGRALPEVPTQKREGKPREVGTAARAADDDVRRLAGHGHLLHRFLADDGLMEKDVVEHGPQRVLGVVAGGGVLHRLADGHPERSRTVGSLRQHAAAVVRGQ